MRRKSPVRTPPGKVALAALASVLTLLVALPSAAGADRSRSHSEPKAPLARVDRDDDKVFDDLEAQVDEAEPDDRIDVIVTLKKDATRERVDDLETDVGDFEKVDRFEVIDGFAAQVDAEQVEKLADSPEVEQVEEDSPVHASDVSSEQSFGVTKAQTDAPGLDGDSDGSPTSYSKNDLVAAVIDTGIDRQHPDLTGGKVIGFKDLVNGKSGAYDDEGHGTHVSGILAGRGAKPEGRGVAPGAALVGVKVLDRNGSGRASTVVAGLDWVTRHRSDYGIDAVNLSLGTSGCSDGTDAESQAVNRATAAGMVVAVAAGNEGPGTCTIGSPGAATGALTVGAMADTGADGFYQAWFSSRGRTFDGRVKPDVSAPGVGITAAKAGSTGYTSLDGTSMATPFVAGTALLMLDEDSSLSPEDVRDAMRDTAVDWGRGDGDSSGPDLDYGAGRLDVYATLAAVGAALTAPPDAPAHERYDGSLSSEGDKQTYDIDVKDTRFPVAATMIERGVTAERSSAQDFDLVLRDPSGNTVARSETAYRQEDLGYKPTQTGTYKLEVSSYAGGGDYFVDVSGGEATSDEVPPTITARSPEPDEGGVAPGANVTVTFSEPVDHASAQAAFSLERSGDASPAPGTFAWSGNTMTFDPTSSLPPGVVHTVTVRGGSSGVEDAEGNALEGDESWSFTSGVPTAVTVTPTSVTRQSTTLKSGSPSSLRADDNIFYQVGSTTSGTRKTSWYGSFLGIPNGLTDLSVAHRSLSSRACTQTIEAWRWTTTSWVRLDSHSVSTVETGVQGLVPAGAAADYVSGTTGDGELRVRVKCTNGSASFTHSSDLLSASFTRP